MYSLKEKKYLSSKLPGKSTLQYIRKWGKVGFTIMSSHFVWRHIKSLFAEHRICHTCLRGLFCGPNTMWWNGLIPQQGSPNNENFGIL